jgi:hypothetical protein
VARLDDHQAEAEELRDRRRRHAAVADRAQELDAGHGAPGGGERLRVFPRDAEGAHQ